MHSNFITPPDFVETVLIIDASEEDIHDCAEACKKSLRPYNVYFYHNEMEQSAWLVEAVKRANLVLKHEHSAVPVLEYTKFGEGQQLKSPAEYFNK